MKIVKYDKARNTSSTVNDSASSGSGSSTTIEGGGFDLDRTIWGKHDIGDDIDGSMIVNGNVSIKVIDNTTLEDDDEDGETEEYEEGGGNLNVELTITSKDLEIENDAYIKNHLYINYNKNHSHITNKKCIGEILNSIETNIEKNKTDIATNKTSITNNSISIQNNADEIEKLKNRTSTNEGAIQELMPIGSIIMYNGLAENIPYNWAICDGTNGTPNLLDKFIKASNIAGEIGGNNTITLSKEHIPTLDINFDTDTCDTLKTTASFERFNKNIPALDTVEEFVFDDGGSSHYCLYTGYKRGYNGLISVPYQTILNDVEKTNVVNKNDKQSSINIEPEYYTLIYIMKIA